MKQIDDDRANLTRAIEFVSSDEETTPEEKEYEIRGLMVDHFTHEVSKIDQLRSNVDIKVEYPNKKIYGEKLRSKINSYFKDTLKAKFDFPEQEPLVVDAINRGWGKLGTLIKDRNDPNKSFDIAANELAPDENALSKTTIFHETEDAIIKTKQARDVAKERVSTWYEHHQISEARRMVTPFELTQRFTEEFKLGLTRSPEHGAALFNQWEQIEGKDFKKFLLEANSRGQISKNYISVGFLPNHVRTEALRGLKEYNEAVEAVKKGTSSKEQFQELKDAIETEMEEFDQALLSRDVNGRALSITNDIKEMIAGNVLIEQKRTGKDISTLVEESKERLIDNAFSLIDDQKGLFGFGGTKILIPKIHDGQQINEGVVSSFIGAYEGEAGIDRLFERYKLFIPTNYLTDEWLGELSTNAVWETSPDMGGLRLVLPNMNLPVVVVNPETGERGELVVTWEDMKNDPNMAKENETFLEGIFGRGQ